MVTFSASGSPGTTSTGTPSRSTSAASSVAAPSLGGRVRPLEQGAVEALRGLHPAQRLAVDRARRRARRASTSLRVSTTGRPGTTAGASGPHGRGHPGDQRRRRQAAGRVVHQDDVDVAAAARRSPAATESCRSVAPGHHLRGVAEQRRAPRSTRSAGHDRDDVLHARRPAPGTPRARAGSPRRAARTPSGGPRASRLPEPAATTTAPTVRRHAGTSLTPPAGG